MATFTAEQALEFVEKYDVTLDRRGFWAEIGGVTLEIYVDEDSDDVRVVAWTSGSFDGEFIDALTVPVPSVSKSGA